MGGTLPTSFRLAPRTKRTLERLAKHLGVSQSSAFAISVNYTYKFFCENIHMPSPQDVHNQVKALHAQLGTELAAGAPNWQAIVQLIIQILQAIGPLIPAKP